MNPGELNKRIEIWGKVPFINELGENDVKNGYIKTIWAGVTSLNGLMQKGQLQVIVSDVNVKFKCRYKSAMDITQDLWIMYRTKRYDIDYLVNPAEKNEFIEISCTKVTE